MKPARLGLLAAAVVSALVMSACADTVVEVDSDTPSDGTDANGSVETVDDHDVADRRHDG